MTKQEEIRECPKCSDTLHIVYVGKTLSGKEYRCNTCGRCWVEGNSQ